MTTEERLEKLERELSRSKRRTRVLLAVVAIIAATFAVWTAGVVTPTAEAQQAGRAPRTIHANKFILEDEKGKTRAGMGLCAQAPYGSFTLERDSICQR